jgi:AcrR family transcriptional regulator
VPPFANDLSSICRSRSATRFIDDHGAAMSVQTPPPVDTEDRPLRADAVRNRARLLEAADDAFTSRGTEASLDDIARSAGVGIGTLYRHFPTRDDLVEALIRSHSQRLLAQAAELLEADDPFDALRTWFRAMLHYSATYRGLATSFVEATCAERGRLANACQEQSAAGAALLARAQEHGVVRADVTSGEAIDLVSAISLVTERGQRTNGDRLLDLALDGLRP